jgi:hypothetical protein
MFDRRPTADDARFDETLERVLRGDRPAATPAEAEEIAVAEIVARGLAPIKHPPTGTDERVWHEARERIEARQALPVRWRTTATSPGRRLVAVAAVALIVSGLSPVGDQALAAVQGALQEVVRAARPGTDEIAVPGNGEAVDDPNAVTVPYDPNAVEDIQPAK